jgi:hypothetical protein
MLKRRRDSHTSATGGGRERVLTAAGPRNLCFLPNSQIFQPWCVRRLYPAPCACAALACDDRSDLARGWWRRAQVHLQGCPARADWSGYRRRRTRRALRTTATNSRRRVRSACRSTRTTTGRRRSMPSSVRRCRRDERVGSAVSQYPHACGPRGLPPPAASMAPALAPPPGIRGNPRSRPWLKGLRAPLALY